MVKLYRKDAATPLFANDPARETLCLAHLAPGFPVPRLRGHLSTPEGEVVVYDHVAARQTPVTPEAAGRLMRRLHTIAPPAGLPRNAGGSTAILAEAEAMLAHVDATSAADLRALRPAGQIAEISRPRLLHGDVVATNLLASPTGPVLIDWQCPALGDPCHDLFIYLSPAMQRLYGSPTDDPIDCRQRFLLGYDDPVTARRLEALAPFMHYRMAAYCLWQGARGAGDYTDAAMLEIAALENLYTASPAEPVGDTALPR